MKGVLLFAMLLIFMITGCEPPAVIDPVTDTQPEPAQTKIPDVASVGKPKTQSKKKKADKKTAKSRRKLRYLYYSNGGGLKGYFNDGVVAECVGCDLTKENTKDFKADNVLGNYSVQNGYLLVNGTEREYLTKNKIGLGSGWAMINYKWVVPINK